MIGAVISNHKIDPKEKERADVVMYPDKFDIKKVPGITGMYVRLMARLLRHPIATLFIGFSVIIGIFVYYGQHPTGSEAFPPANRNTAPSRLWPAQLLADRGP